MYFERSFVNIDVSINTMLKYYGIAVFISSADYLDT